jgi:hypothetical protein
MADHELTNSYPVAFATGIQIILGAIVSAGWATISNVTIDTVGSVIAVVLGALAGVIAHSKVTPVTGGWRVQLVALLETALQDAVSQIVNSANAAAVTNTTALTPTSTDTAALPLPVPVPAAPAGASARYVPAASTTDPWLWNGTHWEWTGPVEQGPPGTNPGGGTARS